MLIFEIGFEIKMFSTDAEIGLMKHFRRHLMMT